MSPKQQSNEKEQARMRNAISLLRVSGDRQDLARQQDEIADVCEENSLRTERTLELHGISGTAVLDNEQIQKLLRDMSDPTIDGIAVSALDRLFRPKKFGDTRILDFFAASKKLIWTARDGELDPSTDSGWETCMMLATRAGAEIRELRRRSMRGKAKNAKRGAINHGSAPYGYRTEHREADGKRRTFLVIYEPEAAVVRKMYLYGASGMSLSAIARKLNLDGIPSQRAGQINARTGLVNTGKWDRHVVYQLLTNRTYSGVTEYPRNSPNPILSPNPQIVDEQLWATVQMSLRRGKAQRGGRPSITREYRLTGLVWCFECGHRLATWPRRNGKAYYRCGHIDRRPPVKRLCDARSFDRDYLEAQVCNATWKAWSDPVVLHRMIEQGYSSTDSPAALAKIQKAEIDLARLDALEQRAYANVQDPDLPREKTKAYWQQCQRDRQDAELVLIQLREEARTQAQPSRAEIEKLSRDIAANPPESCAEWRTFLRLVVKKILVSDAQISIETIIPPELLPIPTNGPQEGEGFCNRGIDTDYRRCSPSVPPYLSRAISFHINVKLAN